MKKKFDDMGAVSLEMALQIHNRLIPVVPDRLLIERCNRQPFAKQILQMDAHGQHFLVVRPVEDADLPAHR
jgi:hypothetical protein